LNSDLTFEEWKDGNDPERLAALYEDYDRIEADRARTEAER
jgi:hypothetical protein